MADNVTNTTFRMRPFSWVLLSLLLILIAVISAPNVYSDQSELLQGLGAAFALIVLVIGMFLIRRMNHRLKNLATVAEAIGNGDYSSRVKDNRHDAIGLLGRAINRMAEEIQTAINQLETQQTELQHNRSKLEQQNIQLAQESKRQTAFGEFLRAINTVDINTIAGKGLSYIMDIAEAQLGQVYVYDAKAKQLTKVSEQGVDRIALKAMLGSAPGQGLPGEVLARRETISIDTLDEQNFPLVNLGFAAVKLHSVQGLPILFQDRVLGVVLIGALCRPEDSAMRAISHVIDALGSALNNALTYKTVQQQALRLEQANQELLEADRLRSEFVANMSHELRTPLNSVIGFSGILAKNRQRTLSDKDLDYVEKINRNGKHLLNLINDILDLSKIEAGRLDLDIVSTRIDQTVKEIVEMLQTQADARQLRLEYDIVGEIPVIDTDADKLKQVLINLIGNAIKFTHEGTISVRVGCDGQALVIEVSDTGIGIPEHMLQTIFEPFRQVDSGTTRKYGGTGLGLAITRSIAEMLGGRIEVRSVVDEGSTFTLRLPLDAVTQPARAETAETSGTISGVVERDIEPAVRQSLLEATAEQTIRTSDRVVLVVDDDADARELLAGHIQEIGAVAIGVSDGEQVLELARKYQPLLITLDLMMPGIDGWEVLRRLKADPDLKHIPVVIISIVAERRQALVLGAIDALTKPIAQDDLLAILQRSLYSTRQGRLLVIDDNPEVLELYKNLLENEVEEIRTAGNGKEALRVLLNYQPNLIFLDLMMPEMDGLTFLRIIRTQKQLMSLPVVIVTAKQLSQSERRELEMRVVQIIQKGEDNLEEQLHLILEQTLAHQQEPRGMEPVNLVNSL